MSFSRSTCSLHPQKDATSRGNNCEPPQRHSSSRRANGQEGNQPMQRLQRRSIARPSISGLRLPFLICRIIVLKVGSTPCKLLLVLVQSSGVVLLGIFGHMICSTTAVGLWGTSHPSFYVYNTMIQLLSYLQCIGRKGCRLLHDVAWCFLVEWICQTSFAPSQDKIFLSKHTGRTNEVLSFHAGQQARASLCCAPARPPARLGRHAHIRALAVCINQSLL